MTLYIARNGEKLGPMSLAQAQEMVRSGTVSATDFAWYEGLATWIPLNQVPGFTGGSAAGATAFPAAALPPPERPIGVWIICILFFICVPCGGLSLILNPLLQQANAANMTDMQRRLYESQGLWNYYLPSALNMILVLIWSIQLFRLKRSSIYFLGAALVIGVIAMIIKLCDKDYLELINSSPIVSAVAWGTVIIVWVLNLALLFYNWYLIRKGTLR